MIVSWSEGQWADYEQRSVLGNGLMLTLYLAAL